MTRALATGLFVVTLVFSVFSPEYREPAFAQTTPAAVDHTGGHASGSDSDHAGHTSHMPQANGTPESMRDMLPTSETPGLDGSHIHQQPAAGSPLAGVNEKLGNIVPAGIIFRDEQGRDVDVRDLMDLPTIIAPVYYTCPSVCNILQSSIASVLPQMNLRPDEEYRVLSVSFDETDTPELAARRKANFIAAMGGNFPEDGWRFLTGSKESVDALMDAIGYRFTRVDKDFVHPIVVVVASPEGKIVRYLYGNSFLPFDTAMALTEAQEGKVGLSLKRIVSYCFSYDPQGKRYVLDVMRIAGGVVLFGVVVLFLVLVLGGKRKKKS